MSGCVNQVENVFLPFVQVFHLDGVALDGDAALTLQIHVVENLVLKVAVVNRLGVLQQTVG